MTFETKPQERRRHHRTQLTMPVQAIRLDPDGDDLVSMLSMVDISRGGIGVLSPRSYYPGQRVLLNLPASGLSARNVCGIVCRSSREATGAYHVGIEFEQPLVSLAADAPGDPRFVAA